MDDLVHSVQLEWLGDVHVARVNQHLSLLDVEHLIRTFAEKQAARRMCVVNVSISADMDTVRHVIRFLEYVDGQHYRLALVCADDGNFGLARMVENGVENSACAVVGAFRNEEAALAWLAQEDSAVSHAGLR